MSQLDIEAPTPPRRRSVGRRCTPLAPISDRTVQAPARRLGARARWLLTFSLPLAVLDVVGAFTAPLLLHGVDASAALLRQAVLLVAALAAMGAYRHRFSLSALHDVPLIAMAFAFSTGVEALITGTVEIAWPVAVVLVALRPPAFAFVRHRRRLGDYTARTIIVGAGAVATRLVRWAVQYPEYGMVPVGIVDDQPPANTLPVPYLGETHRLPTLVGSHGVSNVVVAFGTTRAADLVDAFRAAGPAGFDVHVVPRFFEMGSFAARRADQVFGMPLARLHARGWPVVARITKRSVDIAASGLALALLSPVLLAITLACRIDDGPGVIFKQQRVGKDNRPFTVYKFRSLRPAGENEGNTRWNVAGDARLSRLGKLLRRTSLDELPQLFNVLRGDMSLVGPRPERPHFVELFSDEIDGYGARHRVRPGLTGLAAVHGLRGDTSIPDRAHFDNRYIDGWTPLLDVTVAARTVTAVFRSSNG